MAHREKGESILLVHVGLFLFYCFLVIFDISCRNFKGFLKCQALAAFWSKNESWIVFHQKKTQECLWVGNMDQIHITINIYAVSNFQYLMIFTNKKYDQKMNHLVDKG